MARPVSLTPLNDEERATLDAQLRTYTKEYGPRLLTYIRKAVQDTEDAKDIYQETLFRISRHASAYDPSQTSFNSWVHIIASNLIKNVYRKRAKQKMISFDEPINAEGVTLESFFRTDDVAYEDTEEHKQHLAYIHQRIATVPEKYRVVLELRFTHEYSYERIGEAVGIKAGTVKSRIHRGLSMAFPELAKTKKDL